MNLKYIPYTYYIKWTKTGKWYYGVEYGSTTKISNPTNLWTTYFTSSKAVSEYRKIHGEPDIIVISKIFENADDAILHEAKFLKRVNAVSNTNSLNGHNSDGLSYKAKIVSEETRQKISNIHKGVSKSPETRSKQSISRKKYFESEEGLEWKKTLSEKMSVDNPSKKGKIPWNKGIPMSEETKSKVSISAKDAWSNPELKEKQSIKTKKMWEDGVFDNRPKPSEESIQKRIETNKKNGFKQSEHQKKRVSETFKGKAKPDEMKNKLKATLADKKINDRKICEHCGFEGYGSTFTRYHGDRCKHRVQ